LARSTRLEGDSSKTTGGQSDGLPSRNFSGGAINSYASFIFAGKPDLAQIYIKWKLVLQPVLSQSSIRPNIASIFSQ
jgi:hypothetical protein